MKRERMIEGERRREKGKVRGADYKVRYALRVHLGKNDFQDAGCSKTCVDRKGEADDRRREREGESAWRIL